MSKIKHTLLVASCVALASQFHINFFVEGFIITLSVILFPIFLYYYAELNPVKTGFVTGIVSPLFRGILVYLDIGAAAVTVQMVGPDVFFYFAYGIFFYALYYSRERKDLSRFALAVFLCDFLSNIVEMGIRTRIAGMNGNIVKGLLVIAAIRTLVVLAAVISMKYYRSFLIKEEHEARYRRLMLLTSGFKSEIYFMNKNMAEIEDVMKKSYTAYKLITENNYPDELKALALGIAKDVHEIKKEYIRVIKGLEEMSRDKIDIEQMHIRDIISILGTDTREYIRMEQLDIVLSFNVKADFHVREHFYLMSILKNLINNGIEAVAAGKKGLVTLTIDELPPDYVFIVADNGIGIKKGNLDFIFNPGFSSKFDKSTGDICRGLGLTLVRDLVQKTFDGRVTVDSAENKGTTFTIKIPKKAFGRNEP